MSMDLYNFNSFWLFRISWSAALCIFFYLCLWVADDMIKQTWMMNQSGFKVCEHPLAVWCSVFISPEILSNHIKVISLAVKKWWHYTFFRLSVPLSGNLYSVLPAAECLNHRSPEQEDVQRWSFPPGRLWPLWSLLHWWQYAEQFDPSPVFGNLWKR